MTQRTHRLRIAARIAKNNDRRWEMRRWSAIMLRLSPRVSGPNCLTPHPRG